MNDIFDIELGPEYKMQAFADDLIVNLTNIVAYKFEEQARIALNKIYHWAEDNKLQFNYSKSNHIIITYRKQVIVGFTLS